MRKRYCKTTVVMAAAALVLIGAAGIGNASAYFTTYVSAGGAQTIHLGARTELQEDVSNMTKHISIRNTSQINECFVRVKVFGTSKYTISYEDKSQDGLWRYDEKDGYWYYSRALGPGERTELLDAAIKLPADFDQDSFNVVVIQECTPAVYDEAGNPAPDWGAVYTDYQEAEGEEADANE